MTIRNDKVRQSIVIRQDLLEWVMEEAERHGGLTVSSTISVLLSGLREQQELRKAAVYVEPDGKGGTVSLIDGGLCGKDNNNSIGT